MIFQRAAALLAHAYANTGQPEKADALFREVLVTSTLSETYVNYSAFLASQGRVAEARDIAQKVLARKPAMPAYQKRRERPWCRKAAQILKRLPGNIKPAQARRNDDARGFGQLSGSSSW